MNRIYDLHYEISPLDALLTDTVEQANEKIMRDINACEKHAAVTQNLACRFAEWINEWGFYTSMGEWVTENMHYSGCAYTTAQLFDEFCKTI